ncbi:hypothetical protein MAPG_06477 [Magnaporthiopsis poae ATCC 64411]|uniref:Heterokaryon incompatibility domain-containing protein n=1 Tax=Magnaporthiopsis poae (strain ATCC 64411 / 73-15) TaxID=644358 RepID=A0A0C4E249_MAGP6|nr:hypothetical protein MAPG_06477 [Magnaporthiopsis poae ATCC 64411]
MACELCGDLNGGRELVHVDWGWQLLGHPPPLRRNHKSKLDWRVFVEVAKRCYICAVFLSGCRGVFQQHGIGEARISSVGLHFDYQQYKGDEADCEKLVRLRLADGTSFDIELFTLEDEVEYPLPAIWESVPRLDYKVSPSTDSEEAFELIDQWVEECTTDREQHDSCPDAAPVQLPKRLVDVGADGELTIRLVEFSDSQTGRYICLSHCWGRAQIITTTISTMRARMEGIAESQLSRTFREAIAATRRLGVRYIWIDSLCIIQDSALDWQVESAKMAAIYGNAWLTLAAVRSRDGNGGLFARTPDFEVRGRSPTGEAYRVFFRRRIDHHLEMQADIGETELAGHPTAAQPFEHFSRVEGFNVVPLGVDEYGGLATGAGGTTISISGLWASGVLGWGERVCDHARPRVSYPDAPKGVYHVAFPNGAYHETSSSARRPSGRPSHGGASYTHQGWVKITRNGSSGRYMDDELDDQNGAGQFPVTYIRDIRDLEHPQEAGFWRGSVRAIDHNQYINRHDGLLYRSNCGAGPARLRRLVGDVGPTGPSVGEVAYFDGNNDERH